MEAANRPRAHPGARSVFSHIPPGPNSVPPIMGPMRASTSSTANTIRSLRLSPLTPSHLPFFDRFRLRYYMVGR
jgi:hypothetical protein